MNEREMGARYLSKLEKDTPSAFVCRIPDSPVSRKPFDAFVVLDGVFKALEFKIIPNDLEPHQAKALRDVKKAGGIATVIYFTKQGKIDREVAI